MIVDKDINELVKALRLYVEEQDWERFYTPKNLAMAVTVESAKVQDIFKWLTPEGSKHLTKRKHDALADEIGELLIYLTLLADHFGQDPLNLAWRKLEKNRRRNPPQKKKQSMI
ncbi:MAG: nucleotide pyrophosphohydrolase [Magnetococcales bacterium]|nr:nucleotide pyrophosphohydrolase [Magnetococcales bacterium]